MIVASLASLASRSALLERTVRSLAPQVDAICVYLNGYDRVPEFLRETKTVHAVLSSEAGWRGAEAKLWFWDREEFRAAPAWRPDDIAIVCDDDIVYPPNYVERMVAELDAHPNSVVCVHGSVMMTPFERYCESRMVARTISGLSETTQVNIPGTGTMAFRVGTVDISLRRDFMWSNCVDPNMAIWCLRNQVPVFSVARPAQWLTVMAVPATGMAIFRERTGARNDTMETRMLQDAGPWPQLAHHADMIPRMRRLEPSPAKASPVKSVVRPSGSRAPAPRTPALAASSMLPPEAIDFIGQHLKTKRGTIVELGSGYGTKHILNCLGPASTLYSIEHDERFLHLVPGTRYVHAPIRQSWYDPRPIMNALPRGGADVLIVDGPPARIGRAGLLQHWDMFGRPAILVDDVHRSADLALAEELARRTKQDLFIHECDGDPARSFATMGW